MLEQLFTVSPGWSASFLLVLARLSAAVVAVPVFGARDVPAIAKIGLALMLSLIVLPLQAAPARAIPTTNLLLFASLLGSEVMVGLAFGVGVTLVTSALEQGASLIGVQMGFGLHGVIDPLTAGQTGVIEQFYRLLVTLIFFAVNGHYLVIASLMQTFEVVPAGSADLSLIAGGRAVPFFSALFLVSIRVALPVVGALLLADLAMGLVARAVPQMNVLVVGFPVKIGAGLLVMAASLPMMTAFMGGVLHSRLLDVNTLLGP